MKKSVSIILIVVALIGSAVLVGWLYFRANPAAWDDFIAEMQSNGGSSGAPQPAVERPSRQAGQLLASGTIEVTEINVASELGGRVLEVAAVEGDVVQAGDLLLKLDQADLLAQREGALAAVDQAEAALQVAQAQLALAVAGARDPEIAAADAAVLTAEGGVAAAEAAVEQAHLSATITGDNVPIQGDSAVALAAATLAQAEGALAAAEAGLDGAQAEYARLQSGARPQEIAMYQAMLDQVEAELWYPTHVHDQLIDKKILGEPEEEARYQMLAVQAARDAAQAQLDLVQAGPSMEELAAGRAAVAAAEAQVDIAQGGVDAAQAALDQATATQATGADEVELAGTGVAAAEAQLAVARGQLAQARAQRDQLLAGSSEQQLAALEAQVAQAEAAVAGVQAALLALDVQLARSELTAPSGGIVLEQLVHAGELATPGATLFVLADLDVVSLTVYVPEADLGQVSLGQAVQVTVDAYEQGFAGQVTHVSSEAEFTPKNVQTQEERVHMVFAVKIRLENPELQLKPGMPADALFEE